VWVPDGDAAASKSATLVKSVKQPEGLVATAEGNAQTTRDGDLFVGWGALPYISEFSPSGQLLFNAEFPDGLTSYRAFCPQHLHCGGELLACFGETAPPAQGPVGDGLGAGGCPVLAAFQILLPSSPRIHKCSRMAGICNGGLRGALP
jgi:hypothetical protein